MVTLLKRVCPYCDDPESFQENRNTVKHVLSEHKKFLTPRPKAMQNEPGDKPLNQKNQELYPKAPVKLACPGCNESFNDKTALKIHVDLLHIVFTERNQTSACPEDWIISGVNVSKRFQQFRDHCLRNGSDCLDIDRYFNQLLAMSCIFVVQERNMYASVPEQFFSAALLHDIHKQLVKELEIEKVVDPELTATIKKILKDFRSDKVNKLKARLALLNLADQQEEDPERNVVLAVESLLPAMKDVDLRQISEMHLSATYVHPLVQCLLANDAETVAHCSNTMMEKNSENDKRPDYIADVYHRYNFSHSSSFGEIKVDNAPDTRKVLDFYRLAIFGKGAIEKHSLSGIVTFQVIGTSVTFYYMTLRGGFFIKMEVASIEIPTAKRDIVSISSYLDELFTIICLHKTVNKTDNVVPQTPTLPFVYLQTERRTLSTKRKPSLGSIASSSKRR
ncbi:hypothetical protein RMCBS344292_10352 [Rhizopus microsporus]|nr:hypothetical protein RMCBS344292_10352 [Rhizopus microsporus]